MSDPIPPTPKKKAPFKRLSLGSPSEETVRASPRVPDREMGAIEEGEDEEEYEVEQPESPTKLKFDGLTPVKSPNALDSSFRELSMDPLAPKPTGPDEQGSPQNANWLVRPKDGRGVVYSTAETGPATGIGGAIRSSPQQLPEPTSSRAEPTESREMRSKVNRNYFNPLTTPERGSNLMKGPMSPPYVDKTSNQTKLKADFQLSAKLGSGSFGQVDRYVGKLDGIAYAVKKTSEENGSFDLPITETFALSALCGHPHIIRYCGSWADGSYLIIQTELCNGGSLDDMFEANLNAHQRMEEDQLKQVLLHIGSGLKFMHSQGIVHNDLKPPNILVNYNHSGKFQRPDPDSASLRDIFEDARILGGYPDGPYSAEECERNYLPIYKIGDLGLANFWETGDDSLNPEGDPKYFTLKDGGNRTQADVFALGLSVFECGIGTELPEPYDVDGWWCAIRNGDYFGNEGLTSDYHQLLDHCSLPFRELLLELVEHQPGNRISAAGLVSHVLLNPAARKLRQLRAELEMLEEEFEIAKSEVGGSSLD